MAWHPLFGVPQFVFIVLTCLPRGSLTIIPRPPPPTFSLVLYRVVRQFIPGVGLCLGELRRLFE